VRRNLISKILEGIWLGVLVEVGAEGGGGAGLRKIGIQGRIGGTRGFSNHSRLPCSHPHMDSTLRTCLLLLTSRTCFNLLTRCRITRLTSPSLGIITTRDRDLGSLLLRDRGSKMMVKRKQRKRKRISNYRCLGHLIRKLRSHVSTVGS
jgi:hypothetical protein